MVSAVASMAKVARSTSIEGAYDDGDIESANYAVRKWHPTSEGEKVTAPSAD